MSYHRINQTFWKCGICVSQFCDFVWLWTFFWRFHVIVFWFGLGLSLYWMILKTDDEIMAPNGGKLLQIRNFCMWFLRNLFFHHVTLIIYVKQVIFDLIGVLLSNCPWLMLVALYSLRTYVPLMSAHIINSLSRPINHSRFRVSNWAYVLFYRSTKRRSLKCFIPFPL
jgi:hypothetical protein